MRAFDYAVAENTDGAIAAIGKGYKVKASGLDLLDMLKERTEKSDKIVSIHKLGDLKSISEPGGDTGLTIGALATLAQVSGHSYIQKNFAALAEAAGAAATPQVRARATVGGNVLQRPRCWYYRANEYDCLKKGGSTCYAVEGDNTYHAIFGGGPCHIIHPSNVAPPLVAVNATIKVRHGKDTKEYKAADFFVLPAKSMYAENVLGEDELITEIVIEKIPEKSGYVEFKEKQSFDWPVASCTAVYTNGAWSIVLGHVAPVPWKSKKAEEVLGGSADVSYELAEKAADAAIADADPMTHNGYRVKLARAAVRRAILTACGKEIDA